jgi:hypothetical protein
VVLHAAHVGEAQVDEFDLVVLDELFYVFEGHGHSGIGDVGFVEAGRGTADSLDNAQDVPTSPRW